MSIFFGKSGHGYSRANSCGHPVHYVLERSVAERLGLAWSFTAAWLTVEVHTSLEAVGVTAVLTEALGAAGIPCNVLAGFCHDHLLVPVERADDALAALESVHQ